MLGCSTSLSSEGCIAGEVLWVLIVVKPNPSPDLDSANPMTVKELTPAIASTLTGLFNQQLSLVKLPVEWKTAVICVLPKGGVRGDPVNYRPLDQSDCQGQRASGCPLTEKSPPAQLVTLL